MKDNEAAKFGVFLTLTVQVIAGLVSMAISGAWEPGVIGGTIAVAVSAPLLFAE